MDDVRKEELRQQRLEAMKRGREKRAANIAARKAEAAKAASDNVAQETPSVKDAPAQTATTNPEAPPLRVKRPLSDLFGAKKPKPAAVASTAEKPKIEKPKKEKTPSDFSEKLAKSWYFLAGGSIGLIAGFGVMLVGNSAQNPILIAFGAVVAAGGGWLGYQGLDRFNTRVAKDKVTKKIKGTVNSFNISEHSANFEQVEQPIGMEWKWLNDGKYYHVHLQGKDGDAGIEEFTLPDNNPDEQYFSPSEAVNCIKMPMNEKYLNYVPSTAPKFSVIVLGVIIGAELIGLIAIT